MNSTSNSSTMENKTKTQGYSRTREEKYFSAFMTALRAFEGHEDIQKGFLRETKKDSKLIHKFLKQYLTLSKNETKQKQLIVDFMLKHTKEAQFISMNMVAFLDLEKMLEDYEKKAQEGEIDTNFYLMMVDGLAVLHECNEYRKKILSVLSH